MKKLISLLLALTMVFSLAICASAVTEVDGKYVDEETITFTKRYENPNAGVSPAETFTFTIEKLSVEDQAVGVTFENMPVPEVATVTYAEGDAGKVTYVDGVLTYHLTKDITVTLPSYAGVGIYKYTIKEVKGTTAGVTYYDGEITLVVTVIQDTDGQVRVAAVHTEAAGSTEKTDYFYNKYESGSLAVSKTVTGNMGDQTKDFTVTVTFKAPEGETVGAPIYYEDDGEEKTIAATWTGEKSVTIDLKHEETVTFTNIPEGVTYTVEEADYKADGYKASYAFSDNDKLVNTGVDGENHDTCEITNDKSTDVDTGITLDSMPFVLILAVCAGAAVLFVIKRRSVEF